ncbi:MAG: hypothetical protein QF464_21520, partial [Myxococcota bacterium]|nr:hypothetical protein [Myxococcota bacterium]
MALLGSGPVHANPDREQARVLYKSAMVDMAAGEYLRAALGFDAASRFIPNGILLWNAARAYHRAGALAKAQERYYSCLEAADLPASRKQQAAVHLVTVETTLRATSPRATLLARIPKRSPL